MRQSYPTSGRLSVSSHTLSDLNDFKSEVYYSPGREDQNEEKMIENLLMSRSES